MSTPPPPTEAQWQGFNKLLQTFYNRVDAGTYLSSVLMVLGGWVEFLPHVDSISLPPSLPEPFRAPVDWKALGT